MYVFHIVFLLDVCRSLCPLKRIQMLHDAQTTPMLRARFERSNDPRVVRSTRDDPMVSLKRRVDWIIIPK